MENIELGYFYIVKDGYMQKFEKKIQRVCGIRMKIVLFIMLQK